MPELILDFRLDLVFWVVWCQRGESTPCVLVTGCSPEPGGTMLVLGTVSAQGGAMRWILEICGLV